MEVLERDGEYNGWVSLLLQVSSSKRLESLLLIIISGGDKVLATKLGNLSVRVLGTSV